VVEDNSEKSVEMLQSENVLMQKYFPSEFKKLQRTGNAYIWSWILFLVSVMFAIAHPAIGALLFIFSILGISILGSKNKKQRRDLVANLAVTVRYETTAGGKTCKACAETIRKDAILCRFCGTSQNSELEAQEGSETRSTPPNSSGPIKRKY
jgi:hypothetical protein